MTTPDTRLVDFIWQELCEMPDRSSPEDQPDMALVCRNDLLCIMEDWNEREALRLSAIEQEQEPVAELTHDIGVWKLVPTRPTDRMIEAGKSADDEFLSEPPGFYAAEEIYKAMIEAAPKAPFKPDVISPSVCEGKVTEEMVERAYEAFVAACEWSDWDEPEVRGYLRTALTAALQEGV